MTSIRPVDGAIDTAHSAHQQQGTRQLWFLTVAFVLSLLMPIMLVAQVPDGGRSSAWVITLAICVWSGFRLAWIIAQGKPYLFEFMFWLFVYIFFGLAASVQILSGDIASTTPDMSPDLDWPTALFLLGSLVTFEIGRLLVRRPAAGAPGSGAGATRINKKVAWTLLILGLTMNAYFVSQSGITSFFQDRYARQAARATGFADPTTAAVIGALAWIPLLVAAGAFVYLRKERRSRGLSGRYGPLVLIAAAGVLLVVNPISGARFTAGTVMFALVCYLGIFRTPAMVRLSLSGIIVAFLFLFPILDAFRTTSVNVTRTGFFDEYAGNADYDAVWQLANTLSYISSEGITWGRQALGVLFFWVPRSIWPNKPIDTGILLANFRGYSFTNLSSPLWAEFAINFGVVCTLLLMIGFGAGVVILDLRLPRAFAVGGTAAIIGAILPAYMIILLRGSLLQASGGLFVMIASMAFLGAGSKKVNEVDPSFGLPGQGRGTNLRDYGRYSPLRAPGRPQTPPPIRPLR
jgi:hypothetical protein